MPDWLAPRTEGGFRVERIKRVLPAEHMLMLQQLIRDAVASGSGRIEVTEEELWAIRELTPSGTVSPAAFNAGTLGQFTGIQIFVITPESIAKRRARLEQLLAD